MTSGSRGVVRALAALSLAVAAARPAAGQPQVFVSGPPAAGPLRHLTPAFAIDTAGFSPADPIVSIRFQVAVRSDFAGVPVVDTTVTVAPASIRLPRALPQETLLYWRATARLASGAEIRSATAGPRTTVPWLTLVFPNEPNGTTIGERQPALAWSAGTVDTPPGPWRFDVAIVNAATRQVVASHGGSDTTFVPPAPLEANTPYRWRVTGRLGTADSLLVESAATFVIADTDAPLATLLYQTFPNPFPTIAAPSACIWFDLHQPSSVSLEIFDLQGNLARRIVPKAGLGPLLPAGRYGRQSGWGDTGCDPRLAWDGTGDDGREVPPGVYLVRLRTGSRESVKKILFRGR